MYKIYETLVKVRMKLLSVLLILICNYKIIYLVQATKLSEMEYVNKITKRKGLPANIVTPTLSVSARVRVHVQADEHQSRYA